MVDIRSEFCPCCGHIFSVASRYKQIVDEDGDIMFEKERNLIEEATKKFYNSCDEPSLYSLYRRRVVFRFWRFLCELLSPDSTHGMGTFFLKSFVNDVLKLDIPNFELERSRVDLEEDKYNNTWISKISIRINRRLVVLFLGINDTERIFLSEQGEQWDVDFVYLFTLYGNVPEWLQDDFQKVKCTCLSFEHDVMNWLSYCMKQLNVNDGIIYQELSQFSDMIQNLLSGDTNDRHLFPFFPFADFILSSPENTKAALNIHDAVRSIADDLRNRVFVAIRAELLKMTRWRLSNFRDCAKIGKDGCLYVRSDIRSEWQGCSLCNYGFPNFKFPNEALFELCDKLSFNIFVSRCVKKILKEF